MTIVRLRRVKAAVDQLRASSVLDAPNRQWPINEEIISTTRARRRRVIGAQVGAESNAFGIRVVRRRSGVSRGN